MKEFPLDLIFSHGPDEYVCRRSILGVILCSVTRYPWAPPVTARLCVLTENKFTTEEEVRAHLDMAAVLDILSS